MMPSKLATSILAAALLVCTTACDNPKSQNTDDTEAVATQTTQDAPGQGTADAETCTTYQKTFCDTVGGEQSSWMPGHGGGRELAPSRGM